MEYAYNTGNVTAAGGSDTTSFGYGPAGTPILAYNSTTSTGYSSTVFTAQFQTPIQSGDQVVLEISNGTGWSPVGQDSHVGTQVIQNTALYGADMEIQNSTQVKVNFGNAGRMPGGTASYGAAGQAWNLGGYNWRVKKCKGGQAVGFGIAQPGVSSGLVSASGVPGNTTGNAIAASYVGEVASTAVQAASVALVSSGTATGTAITVQAGVWAIYVTTLYSNGGTITTPNTKVLINGAGGSTIAYDSFNDQTSHAGATNFPGPSFVLIKSSASSFTVAVASTCGANTGSSSIYYSITPVRIA